MDSRLIPVFLAAGWLLVTLGLWGGYGQPWWIWPLSVGLGLLVVGAVYGWAAVTLTAASKVSEETEHPSRIPEPGAGPRRVGG